MSTDATILPMNVPYGSTNESHISASQAKRYSKILKRVLPQEDPSNAAAVKAVQLWRAQCMPATRQCFATLLECCDGVDAIITYRMKRVPSIIQKIRRPYNYELSTLDDVGGCRVIVKNIDDLRLVQRRLEEKYAYSCSTIRKTKDYIQIPKDTGYRSCHILTKQHTDIGTYRVEIQLRTHLQHYWATALEVIDEVQGTNIKSMDTDLSPYSEHIRFNQLTSSLIAVIEHTPPVLDCPDNVKELVADIKQLPCTQHIMDMLSAVCGDVIRIDKEYCPVDEASIFILQFLKDEQSLIVHSYSAQHIEQALNDYSTLEDDSSITVTNQNIVLVHVNNPDDLITAYPNYSANISEYVTLIQSYCSFPE